METENKVKTKVTHKQVKLEGLDIPFDHAIETYKNQLDLMGVKYPNDASLDTLVALKTAFLEMHNVAKEASQALSGQQSLGSMEEPVRVKVVCNNPQKHGMKGEFFGVGNSFGMIRTFVPYNCAIAEDMMIPRGIIGVLRHREFLQARELSERERRDSGSAVMHKTSYAKEFTVIEL